MMPAHLEAASSSYKTVDPYSPCADTHWWDAVPMASTPPGPPIGGAWKPAGSNEWQPLPNRSVTPPYIPFGAGEHIGKSTTHDGEPFDVRTLPPEGPQPIRWTAQKPEHAEHYHAILTPLRNIWHAFTGH